MEEFSLEFLIAINEWQKGSSPDRIKQQKRGQNLLRLSATLDERFRTVKLVCFRQLALNKSDVWRLGDRLELAEGIASWTLDTEVAKHLKGGVPPENQGYQGVIFEHIPMPEEVVVNISTLNRDDAFKAACEKRRQEIPRFSDGIGRYGYSQAEVVLRLTSLPVTAVYAFGGHSSSRAAIARQFYGGEPTPEQSQVFDTLLARSKSSLGPTWVTGEAKDRVSAKMLEMVERFRPSKQ